MTTSTLDYRGQLLTNVRPFKRRASWGVRVFILVLCLGAIAAVGALAYLVRGI